MGKDKRKYFCTRTPETSILKHLSEILGVSVGELLSGERIDEEHMKDKNDEIILDSLKYSMRMFKNSINIVLVIIGCGFILSPLYRSTTGNGYYVLGGFFIFLVILRMLFNRREVDIKNSYRAMYSFILLCQLTALILEMLPDALMLSFASGPNQWVTETFSYFSLTPFGYGEFAPVFTSVLTIVLIVLSAINLLKVRKIFKLQNADFICAIIAFVLSILHLFQYGTAYMSFPNYAITALLLISAVLQAVVNRHIESK